MIKDAILSEDRKYRYILSRTWDETKPTVLFIGLNPSTADEKTDDPTIRKCIIYAKCWGYGKILMANLFAFRSTDPNKLNHKADPVGPENDSYILKSASEVDLIIACWGNPGRLFSRDKEVISLIPNLHCLKRNKNGTPSHPLYLSKDIKPSSKDRPLTFRKISIFRKVLTLVVIIDISTFF
jgi:hypothetical protein